MSATWLVLDVNYLCHRAFHSMGQLSHGEIRTGVIYGVILDVINLQDRFGTNRVVFCFDCGRGIRKDMFAGYKAKRHSVQRTDEEIALRRDFDAQVARLRTEYLKKMGYRNIFYADGYESDDMIATTVQDLPEGDDAIIVTSDGDLLQMLAHNVSVFSPKTQKITTAASFTKEHGIEPRQWARVLSIAGCSTDEVPGVPGVGKKTALKYLRGELKEKSVVWKSLQTEEAAATIKRNRALVKLPLAGAPAYELRKDELTEEGWNEVADALGARTLRGKMPMSGRASRKRVTLWASTENAKRRSQ